MTKGCWHWDWPYINSEGDCIGSWKLHTWMSNHNTLFMKTAVIPHEWIADIDRSNVAGFLLYLPQTCTNFKLLKAQIELNLARNGKKKCFDKYISTKDERKCGSSVEFNGRPGYRGQWKGQGSEGLLFLSFCQKDQTPSPRDQAEMSDQGRCVLYEKDRAREHFIKLGMHKSMGPVEVHPKVLRDLADITAKPLSKFCGWFWQLGELD